MKLLTNWLKGGLRYRGSVIKVHPTDDRFFYTVTRKTVLTPSLTFATEDEAIAHAKEFVDKEWPSLLNQLKGFLPNAIGKLARTS